MNFNLVMIIILIVSISAISISLSVWYFSKALGKKLIDYYLDKYEQTQRRIIDYNITVVNNTRKTKPRV